MRPSGVSCRVSVLRTVIKGVRWLPAEAGGDQCRPRQGGRHHPTSGSPSAPGSRSGASRPRASSPRPWGRRPRARRSTTPAWHPQDIDLIILATSTPDQTFPATAVTIQADLGITQGAAFDVQAVCSGFVFALTTADNYLKSGAFKPGFGDRLRGLLPHSRLGRPLAPASCSATAPARVVVEAQKLNGVDRPTGAFSRPACARTAAIATSFMSTAGRPSTGTVGHVRMDGPEVFRHAVTNISEVIGATLTKSGYQASDIDWFVPHQANKRILDGAARKLGLRQRQIIITVDKHANTIAASIPLALDTACARRPHQKGRSRADRGHGRRLYLGSGADPLVNLAERTAARKPHLARK